MGWLKNPVDPRTQNTRWVPLDSYGTKMILCLGDAESQNSLGCPGLEIWVDVLGV